MKMAIHFFYKKKRQKQTLQFLRKNKGFYLHEKQWFQADAEFRFNSVLIMRLKFIQIG